MTRKQQWCGPQGPLPHEANMQFHLPNLRCKNRSPGRDAHRQRNRLHKGSFYVEGPWSISLCSCGPSFCTSQEHYMVVETWITKAVEGLNHISSWKLCGPEVLREDWDRNIWSSVWEELAPDIVMGAVSVWWSRVWKWERIGEAVDLRLFRKRMWVRSMIQRGPRL